MSSGSISLRLQHVTEELRDIQKVLTPGADLDPSILNDFHDAVNRVRTAAWAMEQYAGLKEMETDPASVLSVLAGERIRAAYQLCQLLHADLENPLIHLHKGQLRMLREAAAELTRDLSKKVRD